MGGPPSKRKKRMQIASSMSALPSPLASTASEQPTSLPRKITLPLDRIRPEWTIAAGFWALRVQGVDHDGDADGIPGDWDNCPVEPNPDQADIDDPLSLLFWMFGDPGTPPPQPPGPSGCGPDPTEDEYDCIARAPIPGFSAESRAPSTFICSEETLVEQGDRRGHLRNPPLDRRRAGGDEQRQGRLERVKSCLGSGAIDGGHLYTISQDGIVACLGLVTGKTVWEERLARPGCRERP
jgi:hypothetical protein